MPLKYIIAKEFCDFAAPCLADFCINVKDFLISKYKQP
jgi:hypothetical protein